MTKRLLETGRLMLAALMLSLFATIALGGETQRPAPPPPFSVHDTDGDGYLSRAEYEVFYREFQERHKKAGRPARRMLRILRFEQIDTDGDGRVSVEEMVSALRERRKGPGWRWKQSIN